MHVDGDEETREVTVSDTTGALSREPLRLSIEAAEELAAKLPAAIHAALGQTTLDLGTP